VISLLLGLCEPVLGQSFVGENTLVPYMAERAAAAVSERMYDPVASQFRSMRRAGAAQNRDFVCGEFNGRNILGGYVGFRRFGYDIATGTVALASFRTGEHWETGAQGSPAAGGSVDPLWSALTEICDLDQ